MSARKTVLVLSLAALAAAPAALGCSVCFGDTKGPMIDGTRLGIWLLLGVTAAVQGAFVAFFIYLRRRARLMAGTAPERLEAS